MYRKTFHCSNFHSNSSIAVSQESMMMLSGTPRACQQSDQM
jgi:hypothetical protein